MDEIRIDDLARDAGITVRTARSYITRGLLPPPAKVVGRTNFYSDAHRTRLRLIGDLLGRGYSLDSIVELVEAWEAGRDLTDLMGLEQALGGRWSDEEPRVITSSELDDLFPDGDDDEGNLRERAVELGYVIDDGETVRLPYPSLIDAAAELVRVGVPLVEVLAHGAKLSAQLDQVADQFIALVREHVLDGFTLDGMPDDQVAAVASFTDRLRPIAEVSVRTHLALAMDRRTGDFVIDLAERSRQSAERRAS